MYGCVTAVQQKWTQPCQSTRLQYQKNVKKKKEEGGRGSWGPGQTGDLEAGELSQGQVETLDGCSLRRLGGTRVVRLRAPTVQRKRVQIMLFKR